MTVLGDPHVGHGVDHRDLDLTAVTDLEHRRVRSAPEGRPHPPRLGRRRLRSSPRRWVLVMLAAVLWSAWEGGIGRGALINPGGWSLLRSFWAAAAHPELSGAFLTTTWTATRTTVAFAVLGTALSVLIGVIGGVLISETWWSRTRRGGVRRGWHLSRGLFTIPRGVHEAVWGLFLLNVFGRDPLVGILAIAIPFGAITAKVYAELIDETAGAAYHALRHAGAGRTVALAYGVVPQALPDAISYGFYRLECSIRSAVILGMIGAGGIGYQLSVSFQSLAYREMWTSLYALIALSAIADWCSAMLRHRGRARSTRVPLLVGLGLVALCWWDLGPDLGRVVEGRTRSLLAGIAADAWPPAAPRNGWWALLHASIDTVQMSVLAIAFASVLAVGAAFLAARGGATPARRLLALAMRWLLLVTRAIPPPVWALLVLFVVFPGPIPGALALGLYNFGILGRLMAEVVENLDPRPGEALRLLGAPPASVFLTATVPLSAGQLVSYALYRWEVVLRETVVVGVVGAGGLGRLLEQQRVAFAYDAMLSTVIALIVLSAGVDTISAAVRRAWR